MDDESAFLRAICDTPFDDLPRLVYADWLEETGEPENVKRAEMIRRMIETGEESAWLFAKSRWIDLTIESEPIAITVERVRASKSQPLGPVGILTRGFIGELHCTHAEFFGRLCRCFSIGEPEGWITCNECDGRGFRPGGFIDQFDRLPITKVVITTGAAWGDPVAAGRARAKLEPLFLRPVPASYA